MSGRNAGSVTAVWTDFGGVLTPPIADTMRTFCSRHGLDPRALGRATLKVAGDFGTDDVMEPVDTPLMSEREWIRRISDALVSEGHPPVELETIADAWFDGREVNTAWLRALTAQRRTGVYVGMLSNMVPTWDDHWRRMLAPEPHFDAVVLSFEVGHRKPDPGMFRLAQERAGVPAHECVLVDDIEANCAGARDAGWNAVHFTSTADAIEELTALTGRPTSIGSNP
ncbi:HAD family hydrolase [Nocardiopsis halotolerans]|uniref:HAD family hydrolase n=1 Tax=Nocardiopsis halotolerans TaxID=124252 RepID=UPI00034A0A5F|nr:HAD family phosphatase [Nocardiopsis halotolerans]